MYTYNIEAHLVVGASGVQDRYSIVSVDFCHNSLIHERDDSKIN